MRFCQQLASVSVVNCKVQDTLLCPLVIYTQQQELLDSEAVQDEGRNPEEGVNAVRGIFASISENLSINKVACLFSEQIVIDS